MPPVPGPSPEENERRIAEYCGATLYDEMLLKLGAFASLVYPLPLYWCTRKMIKGIATCPAS